MAFQIQEQNGTFDQLRNNHIPLDPLSELIQIDKRSRRMQYKIGEIVTYEVDVINRSPVDLAYDPESKTGGVYLEDILPKGLKYVAGSSVWSEMVNGRRRILFAADPTGARILKFGRLERRGTQFVQRPVTLKAGQHLRLIYQTVLGADAQPLKRYVNRATLLSEGQIPISATAQAEIRVVADEDFDQGLLLGRVWCDENQNGIQEPTERGVHGARIYFDQGTYAITDSEGQYHFKQINPGLHAVKIDQNTLMPNAQLTTDRLRVIYFTRGLPAQVDWGTTCPTELKDDPQVALG
jgi:uncharacterized repeat protein (TIGR01451 family)